MKVTLGELTCRPFVEEACAIYMWAIINYLDNGKWQTLSPFFLFNCMIKENKKYSI